MPKAIVFDLDGTLADSSHCIVVSMHLVAEQMKLSPVSDDAIEDLIGKPLSVMFPTLYGTTPEQTEEAIDRYRVEYVRLTKTEEQLFDGVIPMLKALRAHGYKLAIATGKNQEGAENASARQGLTPYFDSIHGILPMDALAVPAEECVMIGDTTYDMQLAQAVGVKAIGVDWGVHSRDKLEACGVRVMGSVRELQQHLTAK
jgi:phosphoglycolate phosphatase